MSTRLTGILAFWRLSQHGGMGKVITPSGEIFFLHRNFIARGEPIVGSHVNFEPHPSATPTGYRQAMHAIVDNSRKIRGDERAPIPKKAAPKASAIPQRALKVLTGVTDVVDTL